MSKNKIYIIIKNTLLPVLFMAFFANISAQTGTIKGIVETADGHPAELVNVSLLNTTVGTVTDSKGEYEINNVKSGLYTLVISYVGLETKQLKVEVVSGETTSVPPITLEESSKQLADVIVQGSANNNYNTNTISDELRIKSPILEAPQNIQVITQKVRISEPKH